MTELVRSTKTFPPPPPPLLKVFLLILLRECSPSLVYFNLAHPMLTSTLRLPILIETTFLHAHFTPPTITVLYSSHLTIPTQGLPVSSPVLLLI